MSKSGEISCDGRIQDTTEEVLSGDTAERGVLGLNHREM